MVVADEQRFRSWLSQLHEAEPVILQSDNQPSAKFIYDGVPIEKQIPGVSLIPQRRSPRARRWQLTRLEPKYFEQPCLSRPTTNGTESGFSRIERNGYKRIPRAKTKEDRYEYKGKSSVENDRSTTAQTRKQSRQKRKHTINEDFQASNVPSGRLTLHSATNLGIFNRGKRSSPVKTRVPDQGFSETKFLSKTPIDAQKDAFLQREKTNLLNYDLEIKHISQAQGETEGTLEQQPSVENITLDLDDTAIRHAPGKQEETRSSRLLCYGGEQKSPCEKPMVYPPMEEESLSAADIVAESSTMGLLDFNMHSSNENVVTNPEKAYWTLENLKSIMQQRISSWEPEDEDSTTTPGSRLQTGSRKRKHTSTQEKENIHAKLTKRRKAQGYGQGVEIDPSDRSTSPRTAALDPCSFSGSCIDLPLGRPRPAHGQVDYAMEEESSQPQRPCLSRGVGSVYGEDTSFISQAFEAAYEAIMRSEQDAPLDVSECVPTIKATISSNHGNVPLHTPWGWGFKDDEILNLSHIGQEALLAGQEASETAVYTTPSGNCERHLSYSRGPCTNQEALLPIEKVSPMDSAQVREWKEPEPNKLDYVTIDPMRNFWRQNKLY